MWPVVDAAAEEPIPVLLVSGRDEVSAAAIAAFERTLGGSGKIECDHTDLDRAGREGLGGACCAVVFGRGLQIIDRWSALYADLAGNSPDEEEPGFSIEIEPAAVARRHPLLAGVGPFVAHTQVPHSPHLLPDSSALLVTESAGSILPLAWAREDGDARGFYTCLGRAEDFRHGDFVLLLVNAIEWLSCWR